MRVTILILAVFTLTISCSIERWEIKEFTFSNNEKVYLKSYSWAIPERNSIILSNTNKKRFNNQDDIDFGSFVSIVYEIKNDSLYIYKSERDKEFYPYLEYKKFNHTKIQFVQSSVYIKLMDSLQNFPKDEEFW